MSRNHAHSGHALLEAKASKSLISLLNQSLADTLDLAYQTKQAHWNVKGENFYGLHQLFDQFYGQLVAFADDFAERVATMGGQALGTLRAAGSASRLPEYPLDARAGEIHVDALADRYGEYTGHLRKAIREAEELGDQDTADLYTAASRAMEKALWMLRAHQKD